MVLGILGVGYVLVVCLLQASIRTVVAVVKEATKVVAHSPTMVLMPLASLAALLALMGQTITTLVNLVTSSPAPEELAAAATASLANLGQRVSTHALRAVDSVQASVGDTASESIADAREALQETLRDATPAWDATTDALAAALAPLDADALRGVLVGYTVFAALWLANVIHFFAWTAMAGACTHWFFHRHDPRERPCCGLPLLASIWRTLRYHLGSVALGALLVAVVQTVRAGFEFLESRSRALRGHSETPLVKLILQCTRLCLWCFEQW